MYAAWRVKSANGVPTGMTPTTTLVVHGVIPPAPTTMAADPASHRAACSVVGPGSARRIPVGVRSVYSILRTAGIPMTTGSGPLSLTSILLGQASFSSEAEAGSK